MPLNSKLLLGSFKDQVHCMFLNNMNYCGSWGIFLEILLLAHWKVHHQQQQNKSNNKNMARSHSEKNFLLRNLFKNKFESSLACLQDAQWHLQEVSSSAKETQAIWTYIICDT